MEWYVHFGQGVLAEDRQIKISLEQLRTFFKVVHGHSVENNPPQDGLMV